MKRMIDSRRIGKFLAPSGFAKASDTGHSIIYYSRPSQFAELWETIIVNVAGKRGEAVGASGGASITSGRIGARWLDERRFVPETGQERQPPFEGDIDSKILRDPEDAVLWEQLVARILPDKARAFAREFGPELLERTAEARRAVSGYIETFGTKDWKELRAAIKPRATGEEIREAHRIATTPPTIQVYNGRGFYTTIVLGIMLYGDRVEGKQVAPRGIDPWPGPENGNWNKKPSDWTKWGLAWRIEMIADRMLASYPNKMPDALPEEDNEF